MVVFTCNNCGESVQKPKVEKHYAFVCRAQKNLTCVDCFKDFRGEEYVVHTKCFTEDERYAAKGTYANGIVKKGEAKQESWVEMVKSILDTDNSLNPATRKILHTISSYDNIPRKKLRFINFIKSSFGGRINMKDVEDVWNVIEKYKNETKKVKNNGNIRKVKETQNESNGVSEQKNSKNEENETKKRKTVEETDDSPKKKKHKKNQQTDKIDLENTDVNAQENADVNIQDNDDRKKKKKHKKEEVLDVTNEAVEENVKFNFEEKILEIVSAKQSITLKKLQKKVLNAYIKETGETDVTPKAIKKFNKKLKKIPNLEVGEDKVTISET